MPASTHPTADSARRDRAVSMAWCAGILVMLAAAGWFKLNLGHWKIADNNTALAEARAWRQSTFDISPLTYETAAVNGRHYNVVGLLFTLISFAGVTAASFFGGADGLFPGWLYTVVIALPLPIAAFWAFRSVGLRPPWAAVFSVYLIVGTSLWPVLASCAQGDLYSICHVLTVTGLLIMAGDLLGRRRYWLAGLGLCIACWSRQVTCLYAAPLLLLVAMDFLPGPATVAPALPSRSRRRPLMLATLFVMIAAAVPMTLNYAKFGNPLESGYVSLFMSRFDAPSDRSQFRLFSLHYMPKHLKAMHFAYPLVEIRHGQLVIDPTDLDGTSIWLTSPLLLGVFFTARRWWTDRRRAILMGGSLVVMLVVNCYCTTSSMVAGHYRYSLDVVPIWLLVIAPHILGPSGRVWTVLALMWSAAYFNILVR